MRSKIVMMLVMLVALANLPGSAMAQNHKALLSPIDHSNNLQQTNTVINPPYCETDQTISGDWDYLVTPSNNIRIWWHTDHPSDAIRAAQLAPVADDAWQKITDLMQRKPPSDYGSSIPCRGGSDHYDIALAELATAGETYRYNNTNSQASASHIVLNRTASEANLIHNLMHAFQYSYNHARDLAEYSWWHDASAEWAIHYVQPNLNAEHASAALMMQHPAKPLDSLDAGHQYGAYLFPLYLQIKTGSSDVIRKTFEEFESNPNSLKALNTAIPGGFQSQWHAFALQLLNRGPVNQFEQVDQLTTQASFIQDTVVTLQDTNERVYELDGNVHHLASHPYRFVFNDSNVRSVSFINPQFLYYHETAKIQTVAKINGQWQAPQDLTFVSNQTFCRDLKSERIEELLVVISNHEWNNRDHQTNMQQKPFVVATNVACGGWEFEIEREQRVTSPEHSYTELATVTGEWFRLPRDPLNELISAESYAVKTVQAGWQHEGSKGSCAGRESGSFELDKHPGAQLIVWTLPLDYVGRYVPGNRAIYGSGISDHQHALKYQCSDDTSMRIPLLTLGHWFNNDPLGTQSVSADGNTITGAYSTSFIDGDYHKVDTFIWTMTALPPE